MRVETAVQGLMVHAILILLIRGVRVGMPFGSSLVLLPLHVASQADFLPLGREVLDSFVPRGGEPYRAVVS